MAEARCPRYYWDLRAARASAARGQTPYTPAVSALFGLRAALRLMAAEGLPAIVQRHNLVAAHTRRGLRALGLRLFAAEDCASPTVTALYVPDGTSAVAIKHRLLDEFGIAVAAGMGSFKEQVLRIAHMGYCTTSDIDNVLLALDTVLSS